MPVTMDTKPSTSNDQGPGNSRTKGAIAPPKPAARVDTPTPRFLQVEKKASRWQFVIEKLILLPFYHNFLD